MQRTTVFAALVALLAAIGQHSATFALPIDDFNSWTQVQDPAHAGMTSNVDSTSQVTLSASGAVPAATDIGYQSVDGNTVATSSQGNFFSASQDFHVAVDFDFTAANSVGLAGIGFGIGEDGAGMNSAGPGLGILNGGPTVFAGAARISDVTQAPILLGLTATTSGRFFVRYESGTGDVIFGVNATPGSVIPSHTGTFSGLQNSWNGDDLLISFFLRSDSTSTPFFIPPLSAGTVDAVFSNFEVLQGTPLAVPEPASAAIALFAALLYSPRRRRNQHQTP